MRLADAQSAHAPVWRSRYDGPVGTMQAFHGTDGIPVWNGGAGMNQQMHDAWGAFATTGSPTAAGLPDWPRSTGTHRPTMIFNSTSGPHIEGGPNAAQHAAWTGRQWQPGTCWHFAGIE